MRDATYVGTQNGLRTHLLKVAELAVAQLGGHGRLQHAVSASRAAAQMRLVGVDLQFEPKRVQMAFHAAFELLSVL